jgi:hypothetical protein
MPVGATGFLIEVVRIFPVFPEILPEWYLNQDTTACFQSFSIRHPSYRRFKICRTESGIK